MKRLQAAPCSDGKLLFQEPPPSPVPPQALHAQPPVRLDGHAVPDGRQLAQVNVGHGDARGFGVFEPGFTAWGAATGQTATQTSLQPGAA